jgi:hypothetical protein
MLSFFTELNRKHPPQKLLDFVMNTTCPIVHAADDRSVMETLEALPFQVSTARTYFGECGYRVGPSAIGCRDNPHGATFTPNPHNLRVCLAKMDPRMRGLFGAAWTLGYIATFARTGINALTIGAPTGPLGIIYRKADYAQPYYDGLAAPAVYPAFHVISGLTRGAGAKLVDAACSDDQKVQCLAYRAEGGTTLWLANLTAERQQVQRVEDDGRERRIGERQREIRRLVGIDVVVERSALTQRACAADVHVQVDEVRAVGRQVRPRQARGDADQQQQRRRGRQSRWQPRECRCGGGCGFYSTDSSDQVTESLRLRNGCINATRVT